CAAAAAPTEHSALSLHDALPMSAAAEAIDPVCGMTVDPAHAAGQYEYGGQTYHFCNPGCLEKFKQDPEHYLNRQNDAVATASKRSEEHTSELQSGENLVCRLLRE